MATVITSECINCGACEPECPNTAIYQGGVEWKLNSIKHPAIAQDIFYIVADKCTECVGFFDHEACAAVCPVDCCVPDAHALEAEEVLIERLKALHPDKTFPADVPSRFRKASTTPPAETSPAPVLKVDLVPPPAPAPKAAPVEFAATLASAPPAPAVAAPAPQPVAPPASAPKTAAVAAPAKKNAPAPQPAAVPAPARKPGETTFPGELPGSFNEVLAQLGTANADVPQRLKTLAFRAQPLLGALPAAQKKAIEEAIGDHASFSAARATNLNVFMNLLLYPLLTTGVGAATMNRAALSHQFYGWIGLGVGLAVLEAVIRLREGVLHGLPTERWTCRGSAYGWLLATLAAPLVRQLTPIATQSTVAVNGFHAEGFEDKLERERRYGEVYSLREQGNGYLLRFEFPRRVPPSAVKEQFGIPDDMPDYDYELSFRNGFFVVKGRVADTYLRRLAAVSPAFPPDFTTNVELPKPATAFKHRLHDKTLEVVLLRH